MNDGLGELRKKYLKISIPGYLVEAGWKDIKSKLGSQLKDYPRYSNRTRVGFTIFMVMLLLFSIFQISQEATEGQALYPVKILTDKITTSLVRTTSQQPKLDELKNKELAVPSNSNNDVKNQAEEGAELPVEHTEIKESNKQKNSPQKSDGPKREEVKGVIQQFEINKPIGQPLLNESKEKHNNSNKDKKSSK